MGQAGGRERLQLPAAVASKFSTVELDMLRKSFTNLAQRSPGKTIDRETFLHFFPLPGLHGERLFDVFDHKHTGVIDYEEFITGLAVCVRGTFDEKVKLIFNLYDIDNTQYISKDELRTMLVQIPRQALYVLSATVDDQALRAKLLDEATGEASARKRLAAHSSVALQVVDRLVDNAFATFDLNKDEKLSPGQFRQWVKSTPEVLDFLESVFPLHDSAPTPTCPTKPHEPISPKIASSASFSATGTPTHSIASHPAAPTAESPRGGRRTLSIVSKFRSRGRTESSSSASTIDDADTTDGEGGASPAPAPRPTTPVTPHPMGGLDADSSRITCSGVLYKSGRRTRSTKARYFMLRGHALYYYYPNKLQQPAGVIFLQGCYVVVRSAEGRGDHHHTARTLRSQFSEVALRTRKKAGDAEVSSGQSLAFGNSNLFGFEIITSQGGERDSRVFFAKTEEERNRWVEAIRIASNVVPFDQRYHRLERIGQGKFATVYKCELLGENESKPDKDKRFYAVKIIDKSELDENERELLRTEVAVLKLVNHPNIINMEEVFESLNHIYIVLEWVEGGELFDRIVGRSRLTELQAYPLVKQLAEAVHYLHILGVAHRDIKPENILCSGRKEDPVWESTIKICDFGLSKLVSPQGLMTLACGTLSYVAPEVLSSTTGYGKAADVWNIGVILYLVRRGRLPFDGETKDEVIFNTINIDLNLQNDPIFAQSSPEQLSLIEGLLAKDPAKRLTARAVLEHPWMTKMGTLWRQAHPDGGDPIDHDYSHMCVAAQGKPSPEDRALLNAQAAESSPCSPEHLPDKEEALPSPPLAAAHEEVKDSP